MVRSGAKDHDPLRTCFYEEADRVTVLQTFTPLALCFYPHLVDLSRSVHGVIQFRLRAAYCVSPLKGMHGPQSRRRKRPSWWNAQRTVLLRGRGAGVAGG